MTCPAPLIMTREGLLAAAPGEEVQIVINNQTSLSNVKRYLSDNGIRFSITVEDEVTVVKVIRGESATASAGGRTAVSGSGGGDVVAGGIAGGDGLRSETPGSGSAGKLHLSDVEEYCSTDPTPPESARRTVVAVTSERMGSGDDELGSRLMVNFFRTMLLITPLPAAVVFYNSGVKLTTDDSPVAPYIRELEERGTEIAICSNCINHYGLREHISAGAFSDMYRIVTLLNDADHIIRP